MMTQRINLTDPKLLRQPVSGQVGTSKMQKSSNNYKAVSKGSSKSFTVTRAVKQKRLCQHAEDMLHKNQQLFMIRRNMMRKRLQSLCGDEKIILSEKCETLSHFTERISDTERENEGFWVSSETHFLLQKSLLCHI